MRAGFQKEWRKIAAAGGFVLCASPFASPHSMAGLAFDHAVSVIRPFTAGYEICQSYEVRENCYPVRDFHECSGAVFDSVTYKSRDDSDVVFRAAYAALSRHACWDFDRWKFPLLQMANRPEVSVF